MALDELVLFVDAVARGIGTGTDEDLSDIGRVSGIGCLLASLLRRLTPPISRFWTGELEPTASDEAAMARIENFIVMGVSGAMGQCAVASMSSCIRGS